MSSIQVFNVKSYGALGNGTNSDSTAIQNAINAAQQAGGGIVYMPAGTYLLTAGLVIGNIWSAYYSGTILLGASQANTTLVVAQNATFSAVTVLGSSANPTSYGYHKLGSFSVKMASPATGSNTTAGISVEYSLLPQLTDVSITDFARGLYATGTTGLRAERVYTSSASTATVVIGAYLDGGGTFPNASIYLFHCTATFSTTTNTTVGYYCVGAHLADQYIHFCEAHQATYGLLYDGAATVNPYDQLDVHVYQFVSDRCVFGVTVQNCTAAGGMFNIDGTWYSPRIGSSASGPMGIYVNSASGVQIRGAELYSDVSNCFGVWVQGTDCSVTQCVAKGNFVQNIVLNSASYCTVFGNTLVGSVSNGQAGVAILGSNHLSIANNTMRGISGTSLMSYGIYVDGTSANAVLSGNVVDTGTVTTPLQLVAGSSGIVYSGLNIGF